MKSAASFLLMLLVSGIIFYILSSSTMTIVMTADAIRSGGEDNEAKNTRVAVSHSSNVKPIDTTSTLSQVKTNLEKAIHAIMQGDKQNAVLQLKSANSQLASIHTIARHGGTNARSAATDTNTSSIKSVKISTTNAINALQSHNIKVVPIGILHLKSAHSKLLSILDSSSELSSVENLS
jgi:hypothetical protein